MRRITRTNRFLAAAALSLYGIAAHGYDFKVGGICYNITSGTECEVTYEEVDYSGYAPRYNNLFGVIVIPSSVEYEETVYSVTSIGDEAFSYCIGLTSVDIPNSVTSIGDEAFYDCIRLTSVDIPNSVTYIGEEAFYGCPGLTSVDIPNSVTYIGDDAFEGYDGLTSVDIPNSVTDIGYRAFVFCYSLTSVTIGNSVTSIGDHAFLGCYSLKSIYVKPTTPPICEAITFDYETQKNGTLYVPKEALEDYKTAHVWKDFLHIEGYDFTFAVGGVSVAPEADAPYRIHGLDGSLVRAGKGTPDLGGLPKGVYVVNGRKVLVE